MKPTKNRIFCNDCGRTKMLFETEKKAETFMKFNKEEIQAETGFSPLRSYYCLFCGGWHITSRTAKIEVSKNEQRFEEYVQQEKERKSIKVTASDEKKANKKLKQVTKQEKRDKIMNDWENQIKDMDSFEKKKFFSENISGLKKEIEQMRITEGFDKSILKDLRIKLEILYVVKKKHNEIF